MSLISPHKADIKESTEPLVFFLIPKNGGPE